MEIIVRAFKICISEPYFTIKDKISDIMQHPLIRPLRYCLGLK